jgi:hypothetical protein
MRKLITATVAAAMLLPLGAQARGLLHKDKDRAASTREQSSPSRVWTPGTEVRTWHDRQLVLLPPWQSEQAALGRDDTSGHIP